MSKNNSKTKDILKHAGSWIGDPAEIDDMVNEDDIIKAKCCMTSHYTDSMMVRSWKCDKCDAETLTPVDDEPLFCQKCGRRVFNWMI